MPLNERERRLLLACSRTTLSAPQAESIRTVAAAHDINWPRLVRAARGHAVLPLVYRSLSAACGPSSPRHIPAVELKSMADECRAVARRGMLLTGELLGLLRAFRREGIRALPFKGPALAGSAYGNVSLRPFNDLDILVHESDVPRAAALLAGLGFPAWDARGDGLRDYLRCECEYNFVHPTRPVSIDLHWRLSRRHFAFPLDFDDLWSRAREQPLCGPAGAGGATVTAMSPEDTLLVLCMHGSKHSWERLGWVCDLAELLRAEPALCWERTLAEAERLGAKRMLGVALTLAMQLLDTPVPAEVRRTLRRDGALAPLAGRLRRRMFLDDDADPSGIAAQARGCLFHLQVRDRLIDRLRYCFFAAAPNPRDWNSAPLAAPFHWLYFLVRPVRLLFKYGSPQLN